MKFVYINKAHGYVLKELIKAVRTDPFDDNKTFVHTSKNDKMIVDEPLSVVMARIEKSKKNPLTMSVEDLKYYILQLRKELESFQRDLHHLSESKNTNIKSNERLYQDYLRMVHVTRGKIMTLELLFGKEFVGKWDTLSE